MVSKIKKVLIIYSSQLREKDYVEPIIQELIKQRGYEIYALDSPSSEFLSLKLMREKSKDKRITHLLLENYLHKEDDIEINNTIKRFKEIRDRINDKQIFEIEGINISSLVQPQFSVYFDVRLKDHLRNFMAIENLIEELRPDVVVTPGETSEFDKGLFVACQKNRIKYIFVEEFNEKICANPSRQ